METKTGKLLDTVEADEVVDIESNEPKFKIILTVQYFRTIDSDIIVHMEDCLSRCRFIDSFVKPVIIDNYSIRFSFVSENMELSDLCDLIQIIQIKHFPCRITNEAYKTLFNVLYNESNQFYPGYDINITSDAAVSHFLSFIMHYFPDTNENEIYSMFIRSFARFTDDDIYSNRDKLYTISLANSRANAADKNGNFIMEEWLKDIRSFDEGFAPVQREDEKWNFIDTRGEILSPDKWFYNVFTFKDGLAIIAEDDDRYNFIKTDGTFLLDTWYKYIQQFSEGYAAVCNKKNQHNYIDKEGNLLFKDWLDYCECGNFTNGFAIISKQNCTSNLIDKSGKLVSKFWFSDCNNFTEEGFALVERNFNYNFIDKKGNLLSPYWFDICHDFHEGYAAVKSGEQWNFIDTKGNKIFKNFSIDNGCKDFSEGFAIVKSKNNKFHFINKNAKLLSLCKKPLEGFTECEPFKNGIAKVFNDKDEFNFINKKGRLIFKNWFNKYTQVIVTEDMFIFKKSGSRTDLEGNFVSFI